MNNYAVIAIPLSGILLVVIRNTRAVLSPNMRRRALLDIR